MGTLPALETHISRPATPYRPMKERKYRIASHLARRVLFWVAIGLIVLWSAGPFLWQINASFLPDRLLTNPTPTWFPFPGGTLVHYVNVFEGKAFGRYMVNSIIVAGSATALGMVIAAAAAYSLARLPMRGKGAVLGVILGISMFPQIALVAPLYMIFNQLHILNTYQGLSTAYIGLSLPLMVFIMYGYFRGIPKEMEEAAKIDGAGVFRIIWSVVTPLALPGVVTAGLIAFMLNWQEFMLALAFTSTPDRQTIPVGIANFTGLFFIPWGDMAAASVAVTIPLVMLVLVFQRRIIAGVTSGGVKG
jgi:ABC-type glycerol-3-phosphate transport system permease component